MTSTPVKMMAAAAGAAAMFALASPSHAVQSAAKFMASLDEIKPICRKLEEPFWRNKHYYGCGDEYRCARSSALCYKITKKKKDPQWPPLTHVPGVLKMGGEKGSAPEGRSSKGSDSAGSPNQG